MYIRLPGQMYPCTSACLGNGQCTSQDVAQLSHHGPDPGFCPFAQPAQARALPIFSTPQDCWQARHLCNPVSPHAESPLPHGQAAIAKFTRVSYLAREPVEQTLRPSTCKDNQRGRARRPTCGYSPVSTTSCRQSHVLVSEGEWP